jgi:hypothetical protein
VREGGGVKGPNFIAKFGRYVSIIGASEKISADVLTFLQFIHLDAPIQFL